MKYRDSSVDIATSWTTRVRFPAGARDLSPPTYLHLPGGTEANKEYAH
jgi:hypothetical protein